MVPDSGVEAVLPGASGAARKQALRRAALRVFPTFGGLFLVMALFVAGDLAADAEAGLGAVHMALEAVSLGVAILGVVVAGRQLYCALRRADELECDLQRTQADVRRWREEAEALLARIGMALDVQFDAWALTDAEREIAILILRGLSYKEIASARGTAERTVRHQALGIFRKAGLSGRAEMAAFFLESMLRPARQADEADAPAQVEAAPASARVQA